MKTKTKRNIFLALAVVLFCALLIIELFRGKIFTSEINGDNLYILSSRILGGIACLSFLWAFIGKQYIAPKLSIGTFLVFLPCMSVAVNNFPFITFFTGEAWIDQKPLYVVLYALVCLSVGFFEEMAFRGCIFTVVLQRMKKNRLGVFLAIVISSVIFGLVHLVNLFSGGSAIGVILQTGYSFLIGGMCAVILVKTKNIWYCVVLHGVYNFAGGVVPECGGGDIWNTPTVILTTVIALAVAAYVIVQIFRIRPEEIAELLGDPRQTKEKITE